VKLEGAVHGERVKDMEPSSHGPAVERALLTAELRRLRLASKKRQQDVAKACEWSMSKFTRIENGASPVTKTDLEALLRQYDVTDSARISELTARARIAREKGWWEEYQFGEDKAFQAYVGYEDGASTIRMSQGLVIPGLLQIPKYTRVIMEAYRISPVVIERTISLRQERQRRVADRAPVQSYILDEAALIRPVRDVMVEQLRHLLNVARKRSVQIRVIPFSRGPHFGLKGPFVLLGFDVSLDDVLYLESARRGDLLIAETKEQVSGPGVPTVADPASEVASYEDGFASLLEVALDPDESLKFIERLARDLS
jgi:transcriptional regulator with XRE-family HTH domain